MKVERYEWIQEKRLGDGRRHAVGGYAVSVVEVGWGADRCRNAVALPPGA